MPQHQMPNNVNGMQEGPDMARINGVAPTPSQVSDLNGAAAEQDAENRKRKLEEMEDGKRVKHLKSGEHSLTAFRSRANNLGKLTLPP